MREETHLAKGDTKMGKNILKSPWCRFLLVIIWGGLIASFGCGGGSSDDGWEYPELYSYETVIGPDGGVIEVTDPESSIYGFKIEIPEGALDSYATITVSEVSSAPSLPVGLISSNPIIEVSADAPFLKEIQMFFPLQSTFYYSETMLCAFYYNTANSNWRIVAAESMNGNTMTVSTQHLSYWRWGEVSPDEVELETLQLFLNDTFGTDYVSRFETAIDNYLQPLLDGTWNYCDHRTEIADFLKVTAENAKIDAEIYLQLVGNECDIEAWGPDPTTSDIFYGLEELAEMNYEFWESQLSFWPEEWYDIVDFVPIVGEIKGFYETAHALYVLEQKQEALKAEYLCIFDNADPELWINLGAYYIAEGLRYGLTIAEMLGYITCP